MVSEHRSNERIVVGVDGSAGSHAALRWAVRQARLTDATVVALHAIGYPETHQWAARPTNYGTVPTPVHVDDAEIQETVEQSVTEQINQLGGPPVSVLVRAVEGHPTDVLLEAAADAGLLVVGRTGHNGLAGLVLGSVSRHCVEHAPCPVVAVPPEH